MGTPAPDLNKTNLNEVEPEKTRDPNQRPVNEDGAEDTSQPDDVLEVEDEDEDEDNVDGDEDETEGA